MRLGIIANTGKKSVRGALPELFAWLLENDIEFTVASDLDVILNLQGLDTSPQDELPQDADFILSFGGDGTFLQTARVVAPNEVPIIGVNFGRFGYLAEVQFEHLKNRIFDLVDGKYRIQERIMLEGTIVTGDEEQNCIALNDIVVDKGGFPRSIRLKTSLDGEVANTFTADGLIIATPTGSTGYSLSVGGPILEPGLSEMIINPISPHMLANRPLVVSGGRTIEITTSSEEGVCQVAADGHVVNHLESEQSISIRKAPFVTKVVVFGEHSFYNLLRTKLQWSDHTDKTGTPFTQDR